MIHKGILAVLGLVCAVAAQDASGKETVLRHWKFGGLSLDLNVIEDSDLGLAYSYVKKWGDADATSGFDLGVDFKGQVTTNQNNNKQDFLVSKVRGSWFGIDGGASRAELSDSQFDSTEVTERIRDISDALADAEDVNQRRALLAEQRRLEDLAGLAAYFLHWDLDVNAGFETNQATTNKNYTYGVRGALDVQFENDSSCSKYNVLDYPFALLRFLSWDDDWRPRGYGPTFFVALDQVEPNGMDPRAQVGDTSDFLRVTAEVAFKTPIVKFQGGRYYFNTSYRYFYEIDASPAVEAADLDAFDYWAVGITSEDGLFLTYRSGQLPFDVNDDEVFELGFKFHF